MHLRRRKYFVNKGHQVKFISLFAGVAAISLVLSGALIINDIHSQIDLLMRKKVFEISSTGEFVFPIIIKASASAAVVLLAAIAALVVLFERRLKDLSEEVSSGIRKLKEWELSAPPASRMKDFQSTDEAMRGMFAALGEKSASLRQAAEAARKEAEAAEEESQEGRVTSERISGLRSRLDDMDKALSFFKY